MRDASRSHARTITAALLVVLAQGVAAPPACAARSTGAAPDPTVGDRVDAPRADAERLADRLLHAVGGRANWARVTTLVNDSRQYRATPPHEVRAVISIDLERPRFRIETTAPDLHLVRVVDGDTDWRLTRGGSIERVPAETRAEDLRWYAGHVYRTLHRLAKRDPLLRVGVGADGRLEVYEDGARIAWYRLDARGEPYAYGGAGDDPGSVSGPWTVVREGIRHPAWNARVDGTWRAVLDRLEVGVPLDSSAFARPAPSDSTARRCIAAASTALPPRGSIRPARAIRSWGASRRTASSRSGRPVRACARVRATASRTAGICVSWTRSRAPPGGSRSANTRCRGTAPRRADAVVRRPGGRAVERAAAAAVASPRTFCCRSPTVEPILGIRRPA